mmetsp:Transcript_2341/g.6531  ORF Transcript_2341/g.6531 Transcript_2341/m.6531 type:complete len:242 (-) Transcript_2341:186-911(-)
MSMSLLSRTVSQMLWVNTWNPSAGTSGKLSAPHSESGRVRSLMRQRSSSAALWNASGSCGLEGSATKSRSKNSPDDLPSYGPPLETSSQMASRSDRSVPARRSRGVRMWSRMTNRILSFPFLLPRNSCRWSSMTVRRRGMFAALRRPTSCIQMLIRSIWAAASENRDVFRSKFVSSPRSRPSVPSTSITRVLENSETPAQIPVVVWDRPSSSSMVWKFVPNMMFSNVLFPLLWHPRTATRR